MPWARAVPRIIDAAGIDELVGTLSDGLDRVQAMR